MGSLNPFKKPKMPDTSKQEKALADQQKKLDDTEKQQALDEERRRSGALNARRGGVGRSLLGGLETGVDPAQKRDTLG